MHTFNVNLLVLGFFVFFFTHLTTALPPNGYQLGSNKVLSRQRRVINGYLASQGAYPWVVNLNAKRYSSVMGMLFPEAHYCGGTLISKQWVLTAAHCIFDHSEDDTIISLNNPEKWHVRIASNNLKPTFSEKFKGYFNRAWNTLVGHDAHLQPYYHVRKIFLHPKYIPGILEYDVALFQLKEQPHIESIDHVSSIELPPKSLNLTWPPEEAMCTVVGWGCNRAGGPIMSAIMATDLPVISAEKCREWYVSNINLTTEHEFCAGFHRKMTGVCPGDSGGPLTCQLNGKPILSGVVSATHRKTPGKYPAIFSRVTYFRDWIENVIKENPPKKKYPNIYQKVFKGVIERVLGRKIN